MPAPAQPLRKRDECPKRHPQPRERAAARLRPAERRAVRLRGNRRCPAASGPRRWPHRLPSAKGLSRPLPRPAISKPAPQGRLRAGARMEGGPTGTEMPALADSASRTRPAGHPVADPGPRPVTAGQTRHPGVWLPGRAGRSAEGPAGCGVRGVGGPMPPGSRPPPARCAPACLPSREKGLSRCVNTLSKGPYFLSLRQPNSSYELAGWPEGPSGR